MPSPSLRASRRILAVTTVAATLVGVSSPAAVAGEAPAAAPSVSYVAPHDGRVLQPFRAPPTRYGSGHRGVDLEALPGDPVLAAGGGEVTWAGAIAGRVWVTIAHPDGIRTSYGPLHPLRVATGDHVSAGQRLGRLGPGGHGRGGQDRGLHWSARRGSTYLDPMGLLERGVLRPALVGPGGWSGTSPTVASYNHWDGKVRLGVFVQGSPIARRPGYAVAPSWHHLVVVPGLNSSGDALLDPAFLGYGAQQATVFSYTGCDPTPSGCDPRAFVPVDTHHGVDRAARDLRDLLRERQRAEPGRPVDLLGYSLGGVVADHYLRHYHDPSDPSLPPIGRLATFASPFDGAPAANLTDSLSQSVVSWVIEGPVRLLDAATDGTRLGGWRLTSPSIRDMQVSLFDRQLGLTPSPPDPQVSVPTQHVAGSRDFVVPSNRAAAAGGTVTHVPGGHGRMARTEAAHQVAYAFLSGADVPRVSGWAVGLLPNEVGYVTDNVAALIDLTNLVLGDHLPVAPGVPVGTGGQEEGMLPARDSAGRPTR